MSQPPAYNRSFSFTSFQTTNPSTPLPGNSLDAELNNVKLTLDAIRANMALIQNDDTTLKNASVGPNQLSSQLTAGFTAPTAWLTGTAYTASPASCVLTSSKIYLCLISHTSGVFATDLAAGKWQLLLDLTAITLGAASQVSNTPAGNIASTDVQSALNELDTEKALASHTHTASAISDSTSDGRVLLTSNLATQKSTLGIGTASGALAGSVNLKVNVTSTTALTVAADFVMVIDGSGNRQALALSQVTINTGSSGALGLDTGSFTASTWYYVWVIAKADATISAMISASSTAPTMPGGYTYKARVGSVRAKSGPALLGTLQLGKKVQYVLGSLNTTLPQIATGVQGTYSSSAPTWASVSVASFFPSTAASYAIQVTNLWNGGSLSNTSLAPNTSYAGISSTKPPPVFLSSTAQAGSVNVELVAEATTVAVVSDATGAAWLALGWEENL